MQLQFLEVTGVEYKNARQFSEDSLRTKFIKRRMEDSGEESNNDSWMQAARRWYEEVVEVVEKATEERARSIFKAEAMTARTHLMRASMTRNAVNKPAISRIDTPRAVSITPSTASASGWSDEGYQDANNEDTDDSSARVTADHARKSQQRVKRQRLRQTAAEIEEHKSLMSAMAKKVLEAPTPSIASPALEFRVLELEKQVAKLLDSEKQVVKLQGMIEML